jgi:predicted nucleic acid-binding protein
MSSKYLLDSTVVIDHLNGIEAATRWFASISPEETKISSVTRAEVLSKAAENWEAIQAFLDEFSCLPVTVDEADLAAVLRNKHRIKLPDAFQAALAMNEDLTLITRDESDFKKIPDLNFKIPYKV